MFSRLRPSTIPLLFLLAGFLIGWLVPSPLSPSRITSLRGAVVRQSSIHYPYINPLLACDIGSEEAFPEFAPLKQTLLKLIQQEVSAGNAGSKYGSHICLLF